MLQDEENMDLSFFKLKEGFCRTKNILQLYAIWVFAEETEFDVKKKELARFCRDFFKKKM